MCKQKHSPKTFSIFAAFVFGLIMLFSCFLLPADAFWSDCAIDWNSFANSPGYISGYTSKGGYIRDFEATGSGDPSHGNANVPPAETDLASAATSGTNPGPQTTPFFGYYNGGTVYDPNNPATMQDDHIFFRMRVVGDPASKTGFGNYHWNILLDVDADGYKEYWIDLEGKYSTQDYDRLNILYSNDNRQDIPDPDAPGVRINSYRAYSSPDLPNTSCPVAGYSHTRVIATNDGTGNYWIEIQVPMTAFKDSSGNQVLYPDSPVAFVYSTGASANDPLQKDWMMDLHWLSNADPITFGDIIIPSGKPIIEFTDSALDSVSFYTIGDQVYIYVGERLANANSGLVEYISVTITNPVSGDDEVVALGETAADTGIFTNAGCGACSAPTVVASDGVVNNSDNNGSIEAVSGDTLYVSYTNPNSLTVTDLAGVVASGDPFIQFTRADGMPNTSFMLTNNPGTSDRLYVTVYHNAANTTAARDQITVALSGMDNQTITLYETDGNTGVFRNYFDSNNNGLETKISDGVVTPGDNLWEDLDGGIVAAAYVYGGNNYTAAASFSYASGAGRVYFTNQAGTQDVTLYTSGQPVYLKVEDITYTCAGPLTVTVTSSTGDRETKVLSETSAGSGIYTNSASPLTTAVFDGSFSQGDGVIEAAGGDTFTAAYYDCHDGDSDAANNNKTDTAVFNSPSILINEILFSPDSNTCQTEFIQLYNASSQTVNITGYRVTDGDNFAYTVPQFGGADLYLGAGKKAYISIHDVVSPDRYDSAGNYYLFAQAVNPVAYPSHELGDNKGFCSVTKSIVCGADADCPGETCILAGDPSDQVSLYNSSNAIVDYAAWSYTSSPSIDFLGDDSAAVSAGIWQDDAFLNVSGLSIGYSIRRSSDGFDTNKPSDWVVSGAASTVCQTIITYAAVTSFRAYTESGKVTVEWETAVEHKTVGFYLMRLNEAVGKFERVNGTLIPAFIGSSKGGVYRLVDEGASPWRTYTYVLIEVEGKGTKIEHGPYIVQATGARSSSDPLVSPYDRKPHEISDAKKARVLEARKVRERAGSLGKSRRGEMMKMSVTEEGLYFVDVSDIAALLGMKRQGVVNMIKNNLLSLRNGGEDVGYLPASDNSGIFFYGEGIESNYTKENIYWLSQGKGLRMEKITGKGPRPAEGAQAFADAVHVEKDSFAAAGMFTDPETDYWFWDYLFAGMPAMDLKSFTFDISGVAEEASIATLTLNLQGVTDDHHVAVSLNGTALEEERWQGAGPRTIALPFDQTKLREGTNTLEVRGILDPEVPFGLIYIDSFDIGYKRLYRAGDDRLRCRADDNRTVTISGFTSSDITLLDISEPKKPAHVSAVAVDGSNGSYGISFVPSSPGAVYLAVSSNAVRRPDASAVTTPDLKSRDNRADYLIISAPGLKEAAAGLAAYREGKGLETVTVDIEEIMDAFNSGIFDPRTIRTFLAHALRSWSKAPRYVVLVGEGTYDYKDNYGFGDNLLPPAMVGTPYGLFPSDNSLADVDGDHVPDVAIGRLPVVSGEELQAFVEKIASYEASEGGSWKKRVLMLADDSKEGENFSSDSDGIASMLPRAYSQDKVYLSERSVDEAREILLRGINEGALLLNYIGHASDSQLADEGLFTKGDVDSLTNGGRLPVVTAMTCFMNNFSYPGYDALGESLLIKKDGGSIAVWGPTGLSENDEAVVLDRGIFGALFGDGIGVLGDAALRSMRDYGESGRDTFMLDIYTILGDPALRMK